MEIRVYEDSSLTTGYSIMTSIETDGFLSKEAYLNKEYFINKFDKLFEFADDLNRFSMALMNSQKIEWEDQQKFILKTLHIRLIENYQAVVMLLQLGMVSQAKVLVRGMLEALFTLVAIQKKTELIKSYYDQFEEGRRRALKASCKFKGEHLKKAAKEHELERRYVDHKNSLKDKTLKILKPIEWAINEKGDGFIYENTGVKCDKGSLLLLFSFRAVTHQEQPTASPTKPARSPVRETNDSKRGPGPVRRASRSASYNEEFTGRA